MLIKTISQALANSERFFILSVKKGRHDDSLMSLVVLESFAALQLKLMSIRKMDNMKHYTRIKKFITVFEGC